MNNSVSSFVFLDTNVLVALYNKKDSLHRQSVKIFQTLAREKARLVVSNYILLELYTILAQRAGKKKAVKLGRMFKEQKPFLVKRISEDLDEKSWRVFCQVKEKDLSFVDCSIIVLAVEENYQLATFDQRIIKLQRQFGYKIFDL